MNSKKSKNFIFFSFFELFVAEHEYSRINMIELNVLKISERCQLFVNSCNVLPTDVSN